MECRSAPSCNLRGDPLRVGSRFWKDLQEWFDFHVVEDAVRHVRIARHELPSRFARLDIDDDQAAGTVRERTGQEKLSLVCKRLQMRQVRWPNAGTFFFSIRRIMADDHK